MCYCLHLGEKIFLRQKMPPPSPFLTKWRIIVLVALTQCKFVAATQKMTWYPSPTECLISISACTNRLNRSTETVWDTSILTSIPPDRKQSINILPYHTKWWKGLTTLNHLRFEMERPLKKTCNLKHWQNDADLSSSLTVVKIDFTCIIVRLVSLINLLTHNNLQIKDQAVQ